MASIWSYCRSFFSLSLSAHARSVNSVAWSDREERLCFPRHFIYFFLTPQTSPFIFVCCVLSIALFCSLLSLAFLGTSWYWAGLPVLQNYGLKNQKTKHDCEKAYNMKSNWRPCLKNPQVQRTPTKPGTASFEKEEGRKQN